MKRSGWNRVRWVWGAVVVAGAGLTLPWVGVGWGQAAGGDYRVAGQPVGGGGVSAGGEYSLVGAVLGSGGGASEGLGGGGGYRLIGGVFSVIRSGPVVRPTLRAVLTGDKLAELTWDVDATGFVLEYSPVLGPDAVWQPVEPQPTGRSFVTPCQQPARFFRFRER